MASKTTATPSISTWSVTGPTPAWEAATKVGGGAAAAAACCKGQPPARWQQVNSGVLRVDENRATWESPGIEMTAGRPKSWGTCRTRWRTAGVKPGCRLQLSFHSGSSWVHVSRSTLSHLVESNLQPGCLHWKAESEHTVFALLQRPPDRSQRFQDLYSGPAPWRIKGLNQSNFLSKWLLTV